MTSSPPCEPQKGLARAVKALREQEQIDQSELAERAGLPTAAITRIESGDSDPLWGDMRLVAQALEISLEALAALAEELEEEQGAADTR